MNAVAGCDECMMARALETPRTGQTNVSKIDAAALGEGENGVCTWGNAAPERFVRAANRVSKGVAACRARLSTPCYA